MAKKKAKKKTATKATKRAVKKPRKQTTKERLDAHAAALDRIVKEAYRADERISSNYAYGTKMFEAITRKNKDGGRLQERLDARDKQVEKLTNAHDTLECRGIDQDRKIALLTDNVRAALEKCEDTKNWVGRLEGNVSRLDSRVQATATTPDVAADMRTVLEQISVLQRAVREQAERLQAMETPQESDTGKRTVTFTY